MKIYADNAATTKMSRTAVDAMLPYMDELYGNPSSLYAFGQRAREALEVLRPKNGEPYYTDSQGGAWRLYPFVEGTVCHQTADTPELFAASGRAFGRALFLRPCCYRCPYACLNRVGDFTLGDLWGLRPEELPEQQQKAALDQMQCQDYLFVVQKRLK